MGSTPVEMTVKNIRYGNIKAWRVPPSSVIANRAMLRQQK
jgi:hypothetical protein